MRKIIYLALLFNIVLSVALQAQDKKKMHYLKFEKPQELHNFYRYKKGIAPLVQGHRGTVENNLPESSIASFEYVLQHYPAVFEIDPRLTKDSVIVVFHDATLDRTTNGTGKVNDYTWAELQQLRLKNKKGEMTDYKIHTLAEVLAWAKGKTALILDKKDVPLPMIAATIRKHNANSYVMNMVRSTEDALYYYKEDPERMFSASIRKPETFQEYKDAGIPTTQLFACIGTSLSDETEALCTLLQKNGVRSLLAAASVYDKLPDPAQRAEAYRKIIATGVSIIESDMPVELGKTILKDKKK